MIEKFIKTNDYLTKSKLPVSDFVINPYVGCPHACKYCYARFMKRFTNHPEPWGDFIDVKLCDKPINIAKITGKPLVLSSVTDAYNPCEEKYRVTRHILEQLVGVDCELSIVTKSALVTRDIDLFKAMSNVTIAISINTLDEEFRADMDKASSIEDRLAALKTLHDNGIKTALFMSPMFPILTDYKAIIERSLSYVDCYWFENLNLRGSFKATIMEYIKTKHPDFYAVYDEIYNRKDKSYWEVLAQEINDYCTSRGVDFINYFYHELIRKP